MKVIVNGQLLTTLPGPIPFGELFAQIVAKPEYRTSVVARLSVDELDVEMPDYEQLVPPEGVTGEQITIVMEEVTELLRRTISDGMEFVGLMLEEVGICVELFRSGQAGKANQTLWLVIEKVQMFLQYVQELVRFMEGVVEDHGEVAQIEKLNQRVFDSIKSLLAGQEGQDLVLVADLLEFEMSPLLREWKDFLTGLIAPA